MRRVAVVTDSNSGMSCEMAEKYGITILPMMFTVDGKEYREGISITKEFFFDSMRNGKEVSTSQPSIADLTELWDELLESYDEIVHIPMSKALSGGYETAVVLSREYDGKVVVVDGQRISVTQEAMAIQAGRLAEEGMRAQEIKEQLEETALDASIYITVETLEYLKKGGRISAAAAVAGEILNIKPVLQIQGGLLEVYGKVRGPKKARKMIEDALKKDWEELAEKFGADNLNLYVGHADAEKEVQEWKKHLEELFPGYEVQVAKLPMSISCHVGPGTVGAAVCVR